MDASVPTTQNSTALTTPSRQPVNDWELLGDTFESMGKIGLALTVGFTAAAVFCRWAEQRRLKAPALKELVQHLGG